MMQKASLEQYLDFYISNQDVKNGKPDPEMYNKAIERMGLDPKECIIVEDNENGIKAARASGANVMIVNSVEDVNHENINKHIKLFEKEI
jgi:HAD superfamily hydrolase (TIGR01509 family)